MRTGSRLEYIQCKHAGYTAQFRNAYEIMWLCDVHLITQLGVTVTVVSWLGIIIIIQLLKEGSVLMNVTVLN